MPEMHDEVVKA
jgi:hypothetical protein